ncbi:hypothetical protein K469DRAFT_577492 [Zopfia rhizophila CBS 207.26]|uniref:Uncharacterized protein n=1 Tax=Zopfia rhizophila CBS 207.26 TaxID=1314779 RepID=A0A6A6E1Z8_9PEZI|nr:hypothetical protein K469DRAFT_577492 [Zopfia rhizophila CBS 207.26]
MKRKRTATVGDKPFKRSREAFSQSALATTPGVDHPVLRRLYPEVVSLRHYLLSRLSSCSKNRRRKISQLGLSEPCRDATTTQSVDVELGRLLDSTLVGVSHKTIAASRDESARTRELESFSQQLSGSTFKPGYFLQSEVGDVILEITPLTDPRIFSVTGSSEPVREDRMDSTSVLLNAFPELCPTGPILTWIP